MAPTGFVLASSSPRRRELLREAGYHFEIVEPPVEEPADLGLLCPREHAQAVAEFKACSVSAGRPDVAVLGADTVVAALGRILGKPADADEARWMLRTLSHNRHSVITGVVLLGPGGRQVVAAEKTFVTMRPMTEQEIDGYIASGEWCGKAGAYAIQETADRFITAVEGSFTNVVGLPMELTARLLSEAGILPGVARP